MLVELAGWIDSKQACAAVAGREDHDAFPGVGPLDGQAVDHVFAPLRFVYRIHGAQFGNPTLGEEFESGCLPYAGRQGSRESVAVAGVIDGFRRAVAECPRNRPGGKVLARPPIDRRDRCPCALLASIPSL